LPLITKRVLITVKAYPNPSKTHGETVCCAGIDIDTGKWIRLYPIPFRDLDSDKQFNKYDIVEVRCKKAPRDHRIESHYVDSDSIRIFETLDSKHGWKQRKAIVLPTLSPSFCQIFSEVEQGRSLGLFKPRDVSFSFQKAKAKDSSKRESCYTQLSFFDKKKDAIESIPFDFYYHFHCSGNSNCPGHRLHIVDWELGQAYRIWRNDYPTEAILLDKIRDKWMEIVNPETRDPCLFVGNQQRFQDQFMILGVFWPPKSTQLHQGTFPGF
jgi:hypothetical protein